MVLTRQFITRKKEKLDDYINHFVVTKKATLIDVKYSTCYIEQDMQVEYSAIIIYEDGRKN